MKGLKCSVEAVPLVPMLGAWETAFRTKVGLENDGNSRGDKVRTSNGNRDCMK